MSLQFPTKNELRNAKRAEREAQMDREDAQRRLDEADAKQARFMRAVPFMDALAAYVEAKIYYAKQDPVWANTDDVARTSDELQEAIAELLK